MGHHSCCNKQKVKRGLWSPEEDEKLINYVTTHGHGSWSAVPRLAGLERCGKSCRLRWINYLRPDLKRGTFSPHEAAIIIELHKVLGNSWSQIAKHLPGRTDNEVKNFWNSSIKKQLINSANHTQRFSPHLPNFSGFTLSESLYIMNSLNPTNNDDTNNLDVIPMNPQIHQIYTTGLNTASPTTLDHIGLDHHFITTENNFHTNLIRPPSDWTPPCNPPYYNQTLNYRDDGIIFDFCGPDPFPPYDQGSSTVDNNNNNNNNNLLVVPMVNNEIYMGIDFSSSYIPINEPLLDCRVLGFSSATAGASEPELQPASPKSADYLESLLAEFRSSSSPPSLVAATTSLHPPLALTGGDTPLPFDRAFLMYPCFASLWDPVDP